jgi:hypothetical protein
MCVLLYFQYAVMITMSRIHNHRIEIKIEINNQNLNTRVLT